MSDRALEYFLSGRVKKDQHGKPVVKLQLGDEKLIGLLAAPTPDYLELLRACRVGTWGDVCWAAVSVTQFDTTATGQRLWLQEQLRLFREEADYPKVSQTVAQGLILGLFRSLDTLSKESGVWEPERSGQQPYIYLWQILSMLVAAMIFWQPESDEVEPDSAWKSELSKAVKGFMGTTGRKGGSDGESFSDFLAHRMLWARQNLLSLVLNKPKLPSVGEAIAAQLAYCCLRSWGTRDLIEKLVERDELPGPCGDASDKSAEESD